MVAPAATPMPKANQQFFEFMTGHLDHRIRF